MSRRLSNRIEAIEYVHADDGLPYRHSFKSGGTITLLKDGSVKVRNRDKQLWDLFNVDGDQQPFLVNPPAGAKSTRGSTMAKRKMSAKQRQYFGKRKSNPKRRTVTVTRTARRRNPPNPPRRARRRRRNPAGFSVQGIIGRMQRGGADALSIVAGRVAVRYISSKFSYADGSMMDTLVEAGSALAAAMVAERVLGQDRARFVLAGGLSSSLETLLAQANIPHISPLLGAVPNANTGAVYANADRRLAAWSGGPQPTLGAWSAGDGTLGARRRVDFPQSPSLLNS